MLFPSIRFALHNIQNLTVQSSTLISSGLRMGRLERNSLLKTEETDLRWSVIA
jgi:hypothetical protein